MFKWKDVANIKCTNNLYFFRLIILFAILFICVIGVYHRIKDINTRSLEYDEIWTVENYSNKNLTTIFTDTATPNNHVLNSLLVKASINCFGKSKFSIRLPQFAAGIFLLMIIPVISWLIFKSFYSTVLASSLILLNEEFIHYSQTARGYSLQCLFISLLILLAASTNIYYRKPMVKWLCLISISVIMFLSVLTIPTSILYFLPICIFHLLNLNKTPVEIDYKKSITVLVFYAAGGGLSIGWLLINYYKLTSGLNSGEILKSTGHLIEFISFNIAATIGFPLFFLSMMILLCKKLYKVSVLIFLVYFINIVFWCFIRIPPLRINMPIVMFIFIGISGSLFIFEKMKYKEAFRFIFCIFIAGILLNQLLWRENYWQPPDWQKLNGALLKKFPNAYLCYDANTSYAVQYQNPKANFNINCTRIPRQKSIFIFIRPKNYYDFMGFSGEKRLFSNTLSGIGAANQDSQNMSINKITYTLQYPKFDLEFYYLIPVTTDIPKNCTNIIIAAVFPNPDVVVKRFANAIVSSNRSNWIVLNGWQRVFFFDKSKPNIRHSSYMLATNEPKISAKKIIQANTTNYARFFHLCTIDQQYSHFTPCDIN